MPGCLPRRRSSKMESSCGAREGSETGGETMSRWFALVRDLVPVIGVIALALFVLWQGAERRQSAAVGSDRGRASPVQSTPESGDGVPWRLAEPGEPHRTERPVAAELALSAGVGISALAAVFFVAYPRMRRRDRRERS